MGNQYPVESQTNRQSALRKGEVTYESATPCKKCGSRLKFVSSMGCYVCGTARGLATLKGLSPEQQRKYTLTKDLRKYGLTWDDYCKMDKAQRGRCAICGRKPTRWFRSRPNRLGVDHNHTTKKVRGLLCHPCNFGIGNFLDEPKLLRKAADYLEEGVKSA